jgi:hypothetical protein
MKMTQKMTPEAVEREIENIKHLFGPPPVFRWENEQAYYSILAQLIESINPRNFLERMQVKHMADDVWKSQRYQLHQVVAINRREQVSLQLGKERSEVEKMRIARKDRRRDLFDYPPEDHNQREAEFNALETAYEELTEYTEIFLPELKSANALEQGINYYDRLEWLKSTAIKHFNDAFHQIERYRQSTTIGLPGSEIVDVNSDESGSIADVPMLDPPAFDREDDSPVVKFDD